MAREEPSEALLRAYLGTRYLVELGAVGESFQAAGIELRVGFSSPDLDALLERFQVQEWAFLTAWNPRSQPLSREQNERRQRTLEASLKAAGWSLLPGEGRGEDPAWTPERSCLILGISQFEALELARRWDQNALLVGVLGGPAELLWTD